MEKVYSIVTYPPYVGKRLYIRIYDQKLWHHAKKPHVRICITTIPTKNTLAVKKVADKTWKRLWWKRREIKRGRSRPVQKCVDHNKKFDDDPAGCKTLIFLPQCFVAWVIIIKNFNVIDSISTQALAASFDFTSFSSQPFSGLDCNFFYSWGVVGWDFISLECLKKSFSLIALPIYLEVWWMIFKLFINYHEQLAKILLKSNAKNALYSIIDGAKFGGIWSRGGLFLNGLMSAVKKKNVKKFEQLLELRISGTAGLIPFKFDT